MKKCVFLLLAFAQVGFSQSRLHKLIYTVDGKTATIPGDALLQVIVANDTITARRAGSGFELPAQAKDFQLKLTFGKDVFTSVPFDGALLKQDFTVCFLTASKQKGALKTPYINPDEIGHIIVENSRKPFEKMLVLHLDLNDGGKSDSDRSLTCWGVLFRG